MTSKNHKQPDRRSFLVATASIAAATILPTRTLLAASSGHLAPLAYAPLPLGQIHPTGWLRRQLEIQANGLSGHLDETWPDVGPTSAWLGGTGESFERGPYWLDGLLPLAYLLDDASLKKKAQAWVDWSLQSQLADGNFGPRRPQNDWWPRMVMLKVMTQYQEATGDARVLPFMQRYFAYQRKALPAQPLASWANYRWQDNVLSVLWLYERQPDPQLLLLADLLAKQGHDWQQEFANFLYTQKTQPAGVEAMHKTGGFHETHGVDIAMGLKSAAVYSRVTHSSTQRTGTGPMLAVLDRYHGLPNGTYSASEHLAGRDPSQGTELCTVVEEMFSLEQAIAASGDLALADRLEILAFNALPGAISDDMWSHQYDQQPNQIECTHHRRDWDNGPDANLFGLEPNFGCCTANFNQGWPKLASSLWMRSMDGGLAAVVYAPCTIDTTVNHAPVRLDVATDYPFRNTVRISIDPQKPTYFPLRLRIPHGAATTLLINGKETAPSRGDGFLQLDRRWTAGDRVELTFAFEAEMRQSQEDAVTFVRGPLVFSLPIEEKWVKVRDQGLTADWQILGESPWNYGVMPDKPISSAERPVGLSPFGRQSPPVTLAVQAMRLPAWVERDGVAGPLPQNQKFPAAASAETITLVPYATTKLRITAFPQITIT